MPRNSARVSSERPSAPSAASRSGARSGPGSDAGFDVVVVGAGVIGLAVAAVQARSGRSVLILEEESAIARGITSRNSEVVHAGIYYPTESLKATLCVEGRQRLYAYCDRFRVGHRRLGKWIVATRPEEEGVLADLLARGRANGVEGLEFVSAERLEREEPAVRARAALSSPMSGIVDAHGFCLALLAEAEASGAVLATGRRLEEVVSRSWGWRLGVRGARGEAEQVDAAVVVDAAGLSADEVAALAGLDLDALGWRQQLCKGDYFALESGRPPPLSRLVYPVPAASGLGIHVTLDLAGRLRFGPDAEYTTASTFEVDPAKGRIFREAVARYLPALADASFVPAYAGLRPKLSGPGEVFRDFVIEENSGRGAPGFVACLGIESPGLTASLAIAARVAALITI